jgi:Uncharacterized protein, possibly involved in aromatic compounds catabolism
MKIHNPYNTLEEHYCFCCSARNPIGLNLSFEKEGDTVFCHWMPRKEFQGWINVLHGGIISTLMDEVAFWAIQALLDTSGVTSDLCVRFLKPVLLSKGEIKVTAVMKTQPQNHHVCFFTQLYDGAGVLCAEANVTYFIYPQEVARRRFHYPGREAFGLDITESE